MKGEVTMIDFSKIKPAEKTCPKCGGKLVMRKNSKDGNQFWGCENFFETGCGYTEKVEEKKKETSFYYPPRTPVHYGNIDEAVENQRLFDAVYIAFTFSLLAAACPSVAEMFWAVVCSVACILRDDRNGRH